MNEQSTAYSAAGPNAGGTGSPPSDGSGGRRRDPADWLPVIAVVCLFVALVSMLVLGQWRGRLLAAAGDGHETRSAVVASIARLLPPTPPSARDPGLAAATRRLSQEPYVAAVWVVDQEGIIVSRWRGPGRVGESVWKLATADSRQLLAALPAGILSPEARLAILTASALRREGEHNDVFRHLVWPLRDRDGRPVAMLAMAYDAAPGIGGLRLGMFGLSLLVLAGLGAYWVSLPLWVYLDARRGRWRGRALAWGAFVFATNVVGLLAYLITRPPAR